MEDFATQGGVITDYEFISEMMNQKRSLMELIEEPELAFDDEEYRDEREDSSRLADKYHC